MLHKLVFDTSDADTIADSHSVGAYLRAGADGALIGHQTINGSESLNVASSLLDGAGTKLTSTAGSGTFVGKQALDVAIISPITVDVSLKGVYDVSTNPTPDNVGLIVNTRGASPGDTTQVERLTAAAASGDAVVAANIHALDTNSFGMLYNGTTWDRWQGTGGAANVNITSSVDAALANTAIVAAADALAVADTAQVAVASPLSARKYLWLYNNDNRVLYIGGASVDAATGFPIPPGALIDMRAGAAVPVNWVSSKLGHDLRTLELS